MTNANAQFSTPDISKFYLRLLASRRTVQEQGARNFNPELCRDSSMAVEVLLAVIFKNSRVAK